VSESDCIREVVDKIENSDDDEYGDYEIQS